MACAAYGDGNYLLTFFHGLISNRFSHLVPNLFCGAKQRGCIYTLVACTEGEMRVQRSVPTLSKTTEVLPILNSQHHWRQKEEAAHIPSGMWCPLLCLLKFCGWEGKQFVGLADIFSFMQMHHCWKTLSASH